MMLVHGEDTPPRSRRSLHHAISPVRHATARIWIVVLGLVCGAVAPVVSAGGNWRQILAAALGAVGLGLGAANFRKQSEKDEEKGR